MNGNLQPFKCEGPARPAVQRREHAMSNHYEVTSSIPMPLGKRKYPLPELNVGDSFAVEAPTQEALRNIVLTLRTRAYRVGVERGMKFTVRLVIGERAVRVWRIA